MRNAVACGLTLGVIVLLGQSAQAQLLKKNAEPGRGTEDRESGGGEAERYQWRGVVATVDDGGWLIALERMDHAAMIASVVPSSIAVSSRKPTSSRRRSSRMRNPDPASRLRMAVPFNWTRLT